MVELTWLKVLQETRGVVKLKTGEAWSLPRYKRGGRGPTQVQVETEELSGRASSCVE